MFWALHLVLHNLISYKPPQYSTSLNNNHLIVSHEVMGQEFNQGSVRRFFPSIWHGLKLISSMQIRDGILWEDKTGSLHVRHHGRDGYKVWFSWDHNRNAYTWPLQHNGFRVFVLLSWGLGALKRLIHKVVVASLLRPEWNWHNRHSALFYLSGSHRIHRFMEQGHRSYLVMGGVSKNLLPYLIHHKLPSGHKLFTFFSHATYTHSSPKSPENSVSSKSRSSSSKSGPGVEETPQV